MEKRFLCKQCKKELYHEDTLDKSGSIRDGFIEEHQVWSCEYCQKDYIIDLYAEINDFKVANFEEA